MWPEGSPRTKLGSYSAYMWNPISGPCRWSSPVLATDPWRTGTSDNSTMEVLVNLRREIPSDHMEWHSIWNRRSTVFESDTGYDMEHHKNPWDKFPPHTGRRCKNPSGCFNGSNSKRKITKRSLVLCVHRHPVLTVTPSQWSLLVYRSLDSL